MKRLGRFWGAHWQVIVLLIVAVALCGFLLLYRLGSLTNGLSHAEVTQQTFSSNWHHILDNPLGAPLSLVQGLVHMLFPHHGQTLTRLPSILFGFVTIGCFAYILRRWYGVRTAFYGTVLFGFSSWFLHASRLGTPEVLYLTAVPVLLAIHIAWQRHSTSTLMTFAAILLLCLLLYIPGVLWLIVAYLALQGLDVVDGWRGLRSWWRRCGLVIFFLLLLAPLEYGIWHTPSLVRSWLGIPNHLAPVFTILKRLADSVYFLFIHGPQNPVLWLDRVPVLSIFAMIMAVAGIIFYARHILAPRTRLLLALFIVGAVLFALGGPVGYSVVIPVVYLVVTGGVGYLLHEWLHVFPRNPLARSIGFGLLAIAIALNCLYGFREYFIAWPHNETTIAAFRNHL